MRQWVSGLALLGLCLSRAFPASGAAALVYDAANFGANTVTAAETGATAAQMVLSVARQVEELLPLEEIIVGAQIAEDLAVLGDIVLEAEALAFDLQSLNAQIRLLFSLESAPDTRSGLETRMAEIRQFYHQSLVFAARTQTLLLTVYRTIEHVSRLIDSIGALIGNKQGQGTLVQVNTTISKTLAVMETQQAAWQRTDTVERLSQQVVIESLNKIRLKQLDDHPRN